jgi:ABC-2 type transport system permease protein
VNPTFVIAKRELLERVRTKWFVVVTLLGPLLMMAMIVVPALIAVSAGAGAKIAIADDKAILSDKLRDDLAHDFTVEVAAPGTTDEQLFARIRQREVSGFLRVLPDVLQTGIVSYQGDNASDQRVAAKLQIAVSDAVLNARAVSLKLTREQRDFLVAKAGVIAQFNNGTSEQGSSGAGAFALGYLVVFLLYMTITLYCVNVMRSVVTEKTSRVMELMVAAVKPQQLMAGKILGVGGAALIQIGVWLTMGGLLLVNKDAVLGAFGASGGGDNLFPPLGADDLAVIIGYFVVGFFFYSSLFAALGAMVSSEQDTQQAQMPVTLVLVMGFACFGVITNNPRGGGASVLTTIPLWSPMLMPMRYVLGGASAGDVLVSMGVLIGSALLVVRAAAKIYRVGVLMYGKRPGLMEVIRWLRY